jgi:hypothetical protein
LRRRARDSHPDAHADAKPNPHGDAFAHLDADGHADRDRDAENASIEGTSAAVAAGWERESDYPECRRQNSEYRMKTGEGTTDEHRWTPMGLKEI